MTDQNLAERLQGAREYVGFTPAQAADRVPDPAVTEAVIVAVENGTADAGPVLLEHLSRVYFRPVEWFRGEFRYELSPELARVIAAGECRHGVGARDELLAFAEFLRCMAAVKGAPHA